MKLSYEVKFGIWIALFLIACLLAFWISPLMGLCTTGGLLVVGGALSLRRAWWLPRVPSTVPIFLMLHSVADDVVDPTCANNTLRPAELEALIVNLLASGYTFQKAIDACRLPAKRSVVLTFDDGYVDNYINLFPILKKYHVPATLFITNRGDEDPKNFLTREQVREMQASGLVEFGGHTANHTVLDTVSLDVAEREMRENYQWLSEVLGEAPICFAYPCGGYDDAIIRAVESIGYTYAFTMHKKMRPVARDPYRIHRQIVPRGKTALEAYLITTRGKCKI